MTTATIATWNVNSIRARFENFSQWIKSSSPDIILLQETKCEDKFFPEEEINEMGYNCLYTGQKSYNGVAILSKSKLELEPINIKCNLIEGQARYIEAITTIKGQVIRIASAYIPQGGGEIQKGEKLEDTIRFKYKLEFLDKLLGRMAEVQKYDELVIFGGDYNVAHKAIDVHNPKSLAGEVGFHPYEISRIQNIVDLGYTDLFRKFNPEMQEYTWWDYRRGGFQANRGWRIDYLMANRHISEVSTSCNIQRELRAQEKPSDHVPVVSEIKV